MKLCPTCQTKYPDDANFCPQEACATPDGPQRLQLLPDDSKPRFSPTERIGGGRTGEVWRAHDADSGAEVAYKIVAAEVLPTAAAQSRAEREFKQLMRVQSPRIATVLDCGKAPDDRLFVAMELCDGPTLDQMLRSGPLPFDKAKSIVGQIGQALLEAQKAGIVHRDVSPKNVLVTAGGEVKVINFPVATPVTEKVSGVPAYVSPEQAQGKPVDQRSNTYSLACIFYHLLTGEPPFQAANPQGLLELHVSSPPLPPSQRRPEANLSPDIDRVILKALDKNSSRRHLTLRLFLTEVEALNPPGAVAAPAAGGGREVGFAKTMLFAGGQAEVASLVAKAIAARTGGGGHATPAGGSPATTPAAFPAPLSVPANQPSAAMAGTMLANAGHGHGHEAPASSSGQMARLTPPPVTPFSPGAPMAASPAQTAIAAAPAPTPAPAPSSGGKGPSDDKSGVKPAFRETLWFKRGDVDQMVADAKAKMAGNKVPTGEVPLPEDVRPLEDRYVDDGTVTTEDRKKFSLRAGATSTALPQGGGKLPGAGMSEKEVIEEIAGPRRTLILVVLAIAVAAVIVVVLMMLRKSPPPATSAVPAAAPVAVPAPAPKPATPPPAPAAAAAPTPAPAPAAPAAAAPPVEMPPSAAAVAKKGDEPPAPTARGESAGRTETPVRKKSRRSKKNR